MYTLYSPHLDQGFPGSVVAKVIYTPYTSTDKAGVTKNYLEIEFEATLTDDTPVPETCINLTNHSFFDIGLDGIGNDVQIKVYGGGSYIVHDEKTRVPTGAIAPHPRVEQGFFELGKRELDQSFIADPTSANEVAPFKGLDTRTYRPLIPHVHVYSPTTKINLEVSSTEPVFQIYSSDYMNIPQLPGEDRDWKPRCSLAVEPGRPTNAVNTPKWRNWVMLHKGEKYGSKIVYSSWVSE